MLSANFVRVFVKHYIQVVCIGKFYPKTTFRNWTSLQNPERNGIVVRVSFTNINPVHLENGANRNCDFDWLGTTFVSTLPTIRILMSFWWLTSEISPKIVVAVFVVEPKLPGFSDDKFRSNGRNE